MYICMQLGAIIYVSQLNARISFTKYIVLILANLHDGELCNLCVSPGCVRVTWAR
jgi:hypothetical protein